MDRGADYANFVIIDLVKDDLGPEAERFFGKPVSTHRVGGWEIFIYHENVLRQIKPPKVVGAS